MAPWVINCYYSGSWAHQADAEHSNDHYNWLQWKRVLFKYISKCTVNWAKVQLHLCTETASGFIRSDRLCSLNVGFIYVSWMLLVFTAPVSEGSSKAREKGSCSQRLQLENAGLGEGRGGEGPATIHITLPPFPKNTYLYLTPNMTPLKTVFLSEHKQDLWHKETALHRPLYSHRDVCFIWPSGPHNPDSPLHYAYVRFVWLLSTSTPLHKLLGLQNMKFLCCAVWAVKFMAYGQWVWCSLYLGFPAWSTSIALIIRFL